MRRIAIYTLVSLLFFVVAAVVHSCNVTVNSTVDITRHGQTVLIDPGHGGVDGGAIAEDGTTEKHINLAIGADLYDLFVLWGYPVQSTRLSDISIHDADAVTIRQKKVSDMRNRLAMYEQSDCIISLHQNHYSVAKYNGTQVFYSANNPHSLQLATAVRDSVIGHLQPQNTRELKRATDGIYLMHHTTQPAILVECGFLSNATERAKLKDTAYQQQLAFSIFSGYWNYQQSIGEE